MNRNRQMETVLIVAAHPDDEVLGCGGTIARHVHQGDDTHVIFMTDGVGSRSPASKLAKKSRADSAKAALKILGVDQVYFFDFPDNGMDSIPLLNIVKRLEKLASKINPSVVYTHHYGDLNVDHRITNQSVLTCFRPEPGNPVKKIFGFEIVSSTEWNDPHLGPFLPTHFVDIVGFQDIKMEALRAYEEEMRNYPHSRSHEHLLALTKHRGAGIGLNYAEAFTVIRSIY